MGREIGREERKEGERRREGREGSSGRERRTERYIAPFNISTHSIYMYIMELAELET